MIRPINNYVLLKLLEETKKGNVLIKNSSNVRNAKVINTALNELEIKIGDEVIFDTSNAILVNDYYLLKKELILGIEEKDNE